MKSIKLIISGIFLISISFGQYINIPDEVTKVATAAGNWLKLETSARAIGMGGAQVAAGQSVAAVPYNPASIAFIKGNDSYYSKVNYVAGISHSVLAFATQLSSTDYLSFHLFTLDSGPIGVTNEYYPNGTGEDYRVRDLAFRVTFAKVLTDRLKVGFTAKYIREDIYTVTMQSFAIDLGSNFDTGIYGFVLGMSVTNFGPEVQYHGEGLDVPVDEDSDPSGSMARITEKFPLPLTFRLGIRNDIMGPDSEFFKSNIHRVTLVADGMNPLDFVVTGNIGMEYGWREMAFARIGYRINHDTALRNRGGGLDSYSLAGLSVGAGVAMQVGGMSFGLDYAYANYGILDASHQFGLRVGF